MWMYNDLLNPFLIGKYLACFQALAITNAAIMNILNLPHFIHMWVYTYNKFLEVKLLVHKICIPVILMCMAKLPPMKFSDVWECLFPHTLINTMHYQCFNLSISDRQNNGRSIQQRSSRWSAGWLKPQLDIGPPWNETEKPEIPWRNPNIWRKRVLEWIYQEQPAHYPLTISSGEPKRHALLPRHWEILWQGARQHLGKLP